MLLATGSPTRRVGSNVLAAIQSAADLLQSLASTAIGDWGKADGLTCGWVWMQLFVLPIPDFIVPDLAERERRGGGGG